MTSPSRPRADDKSSPEITKAEHKRVRALQQKAGRREQSAFLVEGAKSVQELLASDWPVVAVYASHEQADDFREATSRRGLRLIEVSASLLSSLGNYAHNDAALAVAGVRAWRAMPLRDGQLTLALDDLRDPGNLGTILRLADWYGVSQIVASKTTAEIFNPKVIAASMGSFLRVPFHVVDLPEWLAAARQQAVVCGAVMNGDSTHALRGPLFSAQQPGVLVIGNESNGLSAATAEHVSQRISIPRFGGAESLNVGVATGILLDQWRRDAPTEG
ncbi:TrmH family RNA methyltransferase [Paraperlucidibaca baekdonensis]|uniref:TrmH family RNA methyltransferase n=1 Tax=Paraperlucidibaca baekdonensis TaxID=748120 RepID=A0A3E0H9W4_9GAMM|nr:RNA methyltransferase [Paraperlucidibaca baekdonensis]REH40489.1 TrmH family RNA methyltransferase [Paraperlucidibaca baekdonensis]